MSRRRKKRADQVWLAFFDIVCFIVVTSFLIGVLAPWLVSSESSFLVMLGFLLLVPYSAYIVYLLMRWSR